MSFSIQQFMSNGLVYGGARTSKFDISATVPTGLSLPATFQQELQFAAKAASIPDFTVGEVQIPYFGRKIKSAGDRVWNDWQIVVMGDEDWNIRSIFESWNNSINSMVGNVMNPGDENTISSTVLAANEEIYKSDWTINLYSKDNQATRAYTLIGAWPRVIGQIQLDWEQTNRIVEFPVIVAFDTMIPVVEDGGPYKTITQYGGAV